MTRQQRIVERKVQALARKIRTWHWSNEETDALSSAVHKIEGRRMARLIKRAMKDK